MNNIKKYKTMKAGTKLRCLDDVYNVYGDKLFIKDKVYDILFNNLEEGTITLNHELYANEYTDFDYDFIKQWFIFEE